MGVIHCRCREQYYLNSEGMYNSPTPLTIAIKAIILQTFGVQVIINDPSKLEGHYTGWFYCKGGEALNQGGEALNPKLGKGVE